MERKVSEGTIKDMLNFVVHLRNIPLEWFDQFEGGGVAGYPAFFQRMKDLVVQLKSETVEKGVETLRRTGSSIIAMYLFRVVPIEAVQAALRPFMIIESFSSLVAVMQGLALSICDWEEEGDLQKWEPPQGGIASQCNWCRMPFIGEDLVTFRERGRQSHLTETCQEREFVSRLIECFFFCVPCTKQMQTGEINPEEALERAFKFLVQTWAARGEQLRPIIDTSTGQAKSREEQNAIDPQLFESGSLVFLEYLLAEWNRMKGGSSEPNEKEILPEGGTEE